MRMLAVRWVTGCVLLAMAVATGGCATSRYLSYKASPDYPEDNGDDALRLAGLKRTESTPRPHTPTRGTPWAISWSRAKVEGAGFGPLPAALSRPCPP